MAALEHAARNFKTTLCVIFTVDDVSVEYERARNDVYRNITRGEVLSDYEKVEFVDDDIGYLDGDKEFGEVKSFEMDNDDTVNRDNA